MTSLHHALDAIRKADDALYAVPFPDGTEIVFRLPSYRKALQYSELISISKEDSQLSSHIYNYIFKSVCQDKFLANDSDMLPAGVPETVAKLVLLFSGVDESSLDYTETLLNSYRSRVNNVICTMKRCICKVFSGYKYHELDSLNYQQLIEVFVQAEKVLQDEGIISEEGLVIQRPEDSKQKDLDVGQMINKDIKEYNQFEHGGSSGQSLYDSPEYKSRLEQEKMRRMRQS